MAKVKITGATQTANPGISRRELFQKLSPLGCVTLDSERCTACGLCAAQCPTGALQIAWEESDETFRLLFQHRLCTACKLCADLCPEGSLAVTRTINKAGVAGEAKVLYEDKLLRCRECGSPIGTERLVGQIEKRVAEIGLAEGERRRLCPDCKMRLSVLGTRG